MKAKTVRLCGNGTPPISNLRRQAFTLIELLAVVLVILVLAAIGMGVAGYVQKKVALATTKSQISTIEAALESYKSDWGYYPRTTIYRISTDGGAERTNNWYLYRALVGTPGRPTTYLKFPSEQLRSDIAGNTASGVMTNLYDVFGMPFNYYCSPQTPFANVLKSGATIGVAGYGNYTVPNRNTTGGQVNQSAYDLFSYGPDKVTYYGTNMIFYNIPPGSGGFTRWHLPETATDDITSDSP